MAGINLKVQIEINGQFVQAGHITGSSFRDTAFSYDESYITSPVARAISLSLPLSKKAFDTDATVTLYEYDAKGQLATVYYPYTKAMEVALKEEAEENRMPTVAECGINKYLDSGTRNGLSALLNRISWNYGSKISAMQLFIKESYKYDGNGNRIQKITPYGTIDYTYNEENFLISSGWNGNTGVSYTYDKEGNLLTQESELKTVKYAYNSMNRIMYSEVTDKKEKTHSVSYYGYDAFGRRVIEQDKDEAALRSLYDSFTFDVIKQSPTFTNGLFVDSNEIGIRISRTGRPTGDRYRYLEDTPQQDGNRYFHLDEGNYRNVSSRYKGSRTVLTVNGTIAGQNTDGEVSYFTTDLLGTVRTTTDGYGYTDKTYSYDAFGAIIEGDLSGRQNFGYLGKQFDSQTGLYNYGYRDYTPKVARFTTVDPIRDGENWLTYCKNDAVNFVDLWGLKITDSNKKLANYIFLGKNMGEAVCPTINILIKFSDNTNSNGATKGTLTVYWADDKDVDLDLLGTPVLTVPIVSGSTNDSPTPYGTYKNLSQEKTSTSSNEILKDNAHGGENNIMIRLPNTNGDAIHQGNNMATIDSAYTNGCSAITAYELNIDTQTRETDVDRNYEAFKQSLIPYGYQGVKPNVYVW